MGGDLVSDMAPEVLLSGATEKLTPSGANSSVNASEAALLGRPGTGFLIVDIPSSAQYIIKLSFYCEAWAART